MKFNLEDENRNLRSKLIEEQEKFSHCKKNFKEKIVELENKVSDLEFLNAEQSINLKVLEEELINKTSSNRTPDSLLTKTSSDFSKSSHSCFRVHTSSIAGINNYISILAKAKDDAINHKKESAHLHSELEKFKKKLVAKNVEIEKLKFDLDTARKQSDRKICSCHDIDSCYESLEDARFDSRSDDSNRRFQSSKSCKSRSVGQQSPSKGSVQQHFVSDAAVQVNELESVLTDRLDEYIRKAKNLIPSNAANDNHIVDKLEEERDFYCREYHRLKDKVLYTLRRPDKHPNSECPFLILDKIGNEMKWQRKEIEKLKEAFESKKECSCRHANLQEDLEQRLRRLESRESELLSVNDRLASKVRKMEDICDEYREKIRTLNKENKQQKSVYHQVRLMQDDSERTLFNAQDALRKCDSELNCALAKINQLEEENKRIKRDLSIVESEKKCLKKNLVQLDHEKDNIVSKLDDKTELVVRLEKEVAERKKRITELENKVGKLEDSLRTLQNIQLKTEESARHTKKSYATMQQELDDLQKSKEALIKENRRLQDNLSAAVRDCFHSNSELQSAKTEVEELKVRLQSYVSEVRRIEDILQVKEDERRSMLEQLKGLNLEYSSNASKSRTLDNSDGIVYDDYSGLQASHRDLLDKYLHDNR